jgi:leucine efflux protein
MFFVSFFVQFVDPNYPHPGLTFLMLGLIVQFFSVIYLLGLIHGGTRLAASFGQYRRLALISTVTVGLLFIGFALRLAI